jgi:hypothetical protein
MDDQVTGLSINEIVQCVIVRVADRDMIEVPIPLITVVEWWLAAAYTILLQICHGSSPEEVADGSPKCKKRTLLGISVGSRLAWRSRLRGGGHGPPQATSFRK